MKKVKINNQISANELRVIIDIDGVGKNFGILKISDAIAKAKELGLDLIEISPNAKPPIAKIMDYGKFQYEEKKKIRDAGKAHTVEVRVIQIGLGTSGDDLERKAKKASEFLSNGDRVKVAMILRGREKYLDRSFIQERIDRFLNLISENYKIADSPKKGPKGINLIIEYVKDKKIIKQTVKSDKKEESVVKKVGTKSF